MLELLIAILFSLGISIDDLSLFKDDNEVKQKLEEVYKATDNVDVNDGGFIVTDDVNPSN